MKCLIYAAPTRNSVAISASYTYFSKADARFHSKLDVRFDSKAAVRQF
jgi:hypothetical protein